MKVAKSRKNLIRFALPVVIILTAIIVWFFTHGAAESIKVFWLPIAAALLFVASPLGNRKLGTQADTPGHTLFPWILRIVLLELFLIGSFIGITYISTQALPVHVAENTQIFSHTLRYFTLQLGLFPWSLYALIAVAMGFVAYRSNKNAHLSTLLFPIFKSREQQTFGAIFNMTAKIATGFAFASTLMFFTLLIASLVSPHHLPIAYGFSTATTLIVLVLLGLSFTSIFHKYLQRILSHPIPYGLTLSLLCVLLAAVILLLSLIFIGVSGANTGKIPGIVKTLQQKNWHDFWLIFSSSWWISWTIVISSHIARISRGRSARAVILAVLSLPVLAGIYFYLSTTGSVSLFSIHPLIIYVVSIVGFIGLLSIIGTRKYLTTLFFSYLPKHGSNKPHQHEAFSKKFFFKRSWQLVMGLLYLYLPTGIPALSIFFFMAIAPLAILLLLSCTTVFFIKKS